MTLAQRLVELAIEIVHRVRGHARRANEAVEGIGVDFLEPQFGKVGTLGSDLVRRDVEGARTAALRHMLASIESITIAESRR